MPREFTKQPSENLDYDFDWTDWMVAGDAISSSTITADSGITVGAKTISGAVVKQFLSAGTADADYKVTCQITTSQGRIGEREITIHVREF